MRPSAGTLFLQPLQRHTAGCVASRLYNRDILVRDKDEKVRYRFGRKSHDMWDGHDIPIFEDMFSVPPINVPHYAVLQFESVNSTHSVLESMLPALKIEGIDLLVTSEHQIAGRGRRGERVWSSPSGCAMFSFTFRCHTDSIIGQRPAFMQHIVCLAIVQSLPQIPSLRIKWPNDVYYKQQKISGLIVNCHLDFKQITALIGVGINLDNTEPTDCVNRILRDDMGSDVKITKEQLIPAVINNFRESVAGIKTEEDFSKLKKMYTDKWMHTGQKLVHEGKELVIRDVDEQGFLLAESCDDGTTVVVGHNFEGISLSLTL